MVRENVWDYPRPPRLERIVAEIRIVFAGAVIVETQAAHRVLETSHPPVYYLAPDDFRCEILPGEGASVCEWKGRARYWSLRVGDRTAVDCAWSYPAPTKAFAAIRDHLAVYPAAMDACSIDGASVMPQPGGFYGGWVTPNLVGPFKGGPGTAGW